MDDNFLTVSGEYESTLVIERSKFICYLKGVSDEEDAKAYVLRIKKQNSLATHNCYAYIADEKGQLQKFSDDGEPQGTAGFPMLEVMKNKKLYKTVAVVTRYFGGIKLGTGGLARAYSNSVANCIDCAQIVDMNKAVVYEFDFDYENYSNYLRFLDGKKVKTLNTEFLNSVKILLAIKKAESENFIKELSNYFLGKLNYTFVKEEYVAF